MRLSWERRRRDDAKSDFREGGVTGTGGGRTSVMIVSGRSHTSARSATKMPRTSHFPAPGGHVSVRNRGPITRCRLLVPYRGLKVDSASVTVGQHGRKRGVLGISVTGSDSRHGSVSLPSLPRHAPVPVPPRLSYPALSPRPQPARAVARGPRPLSGRQLEKPDPSRRASLRAPIPRDAPACGAPSPPGTSLRGPVPPPSRKPGSRCAWNQPSA